MSCVIERMSWSEIIDTYSLYISENDVYMFITPEGNEQKQNELIELLIEVQKNPDDNYKVKEFLEQNTKYFDKLKYVMAVNFNCKLEMRNLKGRKYDQTTRREQDVLNVHEQTLRGMREALRSGADKSIGVIVTSNDEERKKKLFILTLDFLVDAENEVSKRKIQQKNIFSKSQCSLYEMLYQSPEEIFYEADKDDVIKAAAESTALLNVDKEDRVVNDELLKRTLQENRDEYVKQLAYVVEENFEFMDIERMLIRAVSINLEDIDNPETSEEERRKIIKRLEKMMSLGSKIFQKGIAEKNENIQQFNELKQRYKKRTLDGQFIAKDNLQIVVDGLNSGKYKLRQLSDDILSLVGEVPVEIWLKSKENFIFAIKNNYTKDKSIYDIISENGQCSTEVILYTLGNNIMSKDDIIDLYMQKVITLDQVRIIEQNLGEQLISLEDIMQKYKEDYETIHTEGEKSKSPDEVKGKEKIEKGNEYRECSEKEKNEIDDKKTKKTRKKSFEELATQAIALKELGFESEIVEEALIEMDSEEIETAMMIFYTNYLLNAKAVFESCGVEVIQFLRPVDIRNLYNDGSITIENLKKAVRGMDEEKAIHFICKTFPENEFELETLIETIEMDVVEDEELRKTGRSRQRNSKPDFYTSKSDIGISAIVNKYKFYESLDENYSNTYYRNGFEVFELPNVKYENTEDSWIVVEPMIDKSHKSDRVKAAQDKAMWILPKSLWERHKERIVGSDYTIKTGMLRWLYDSLESKQMTKMHHIISNQEKIKEKEIDVERGKLPRHGWPFRIIRKAKSGRQYTEEEEKELLKLGLQLEKSMIRE